MTAAIDGVGLAILPCSLADGEPRLRRLSEVLVRAPLSLVHRREVRLSEPSRAVIAFTVAVIKRNAARIDGSEARSEVHAELAGREGDAD